MAVRGDLGSSNADLFRQAFASVDCAVIGAVRRSRESGARIAAFEAAAGEVTDCHATATRSF